MRTYLKSIFTFVLVLCLLCNIAFTEGDVRLSTGVPLTSNVQLETLDVSISILYDNTYHENVLLAGKELALELTAHNTSAELKMIQFFVGMYDANKNIVEIALDDVTIAAGATETAVVSSMIPENASVEQAIVYIWDTLNSTGPHIAFTMHPTVEDYYGNSFADASSISDINHEIAGSINTAGDADYIKFTAQNSGFYIFNCSGANDVRATLYNSTQAVQASNSVHFIAYLTQGQTYYVKIDKASGTGDYSLSAQYAAFANIPLSDLDVSISIRYGDSYYENVLLAGQEVTLEFEAYNTSANMKNIQFSIGFCDSNDNMIDFASADTKIAAGRTEMVVLSRTVPRASNLEQAFLYIWDDSSNGIHIPLTMLPNEADYYGNSLSTATLIKSTTMQMSGSINTSDDVDWFKFTPTVTGKYGVSMTGFEGSHIFVTDGAGYTDETYGDLVSIQQMRFDFVSGNDYYIQVNAIANQGSYKISVAKLIDISNLTANFNSTTNVISVSGNISAGQGENISISIYNPEDNCEQVDSIESGEGGFFTYSYKTPNPLQGTYQAIVSNYLLTECGYTTFNNGTASQYVNRRQEITSAPFLMQANTHIAIDDVVDSVAITPGEKAQANVVLTNNNSTSQQVTVGIAFYDENNYMTNYQGIAKRVEAGETEEFYPSIVLPSDKDILKIKTIIFEGAGVYGNSNVMVAETVEVSGGLITRYGRSDNTEIAENMQLRSPAEPIYNFTAEDKERLIQSVKQKNNKSTGSGVTPMSYTPYGIQLNTSNDTLDVEVAFMSNDYFLERYFTDNVRERFMITVKNKKNYAVSIMPYINTSYETENNQSYNDARIAGASIDRLRANETKIITIDIEPHSHDDTHFNPGQRWGHQIIVISFVDYIGSGLEDWLYVNLYPINRGLFGNSFDNAYSITPPNGQSTDNSTFIGYMDNAGDVDYCKFKPSLSGKYTFSSAGYGNVYGELYDASKSRLTGDNSGGNDKDTFSFTYNLTAGNTYYVKMSHNIGKPIGICVLYVTAPSGGGGGSSGSLTVQNLRYTVGPKLGKGNQISFDVRNTMSSSQSFRAVAYVNWRGQQRVEKARTTLISVGANKTISVNIPEFSMYLEGPGLTTTIEIERSSGTMLTSASRTNTVEDLGGNVEPQKLEFTKDSGTVTNPHYYLFDDNIEFPTVNDLADNGAASTTIAHFGNLGKGTYTFFGYHNRNENTFTGSHLYYDPVFWNPAGVSGNVKITKVGADPMNWDWNQVWADFSRETVYAPKFVVNGNELSSIPLVPINNNYVSLPNDYTIGANSKTWFSQFLASGQIDEMSGACWIMFEFEVTSGTVNFDTLAYQNKDSKDSINIAAIAKGNYCDDIGNPTIKGKSDYAPVVNAELEYFIDGTVPNRTVLPVEVVNQFHPEGHQNNLNIFTTRVTSYSAAGKPGTQGNWETADDSNMLPFTYTDNGGSGKTWQFDPTHDYLTGATLPTPPTGPVGGVNKSHLGNYGVTEKYKISIHNAGGERLLSYRLEGQGFYIYKVNVKYDGINQTGGNYDKQLFRYAYMDQYDRNQNLLGQSITTYEYIDIPLPAGETTEVELEVTLTTGCNMTLHNSLVINRNTSIERTGDIQ